MDTIITAIIGASLVFSGAIATDASAAVTTTITYSASAGITA